MKFIPTAISRGVAQQKLAASENAPTLLFGAGVFGMVGSTVLACRATLKLEAVLDQVQNNLNNVQNAVEVAEDPENDLKYPDRERRRDTAIIVARGVRDVTRLYAPSVAVGAASIACLTKSHNILKDRNLALTAAYAAVDGAFTRYRERVVEKFGEEVDQDLMYESEEIQIIDEETGKVVTTTRVTGAPGSIYARFYAEWSSRNWSPDPDINHMFLRQQQNWANDRLKARGHVFLNEVYDMLGLEHTMEGAVVGWLWDRGTGDDYIDFGIWDGTHEVVNDFFHGNEGAILLDFNVDGVIHNRLQAIELGLGAIREEDLRD